MLNASALASAGQQQTASFPENLIVLPPTAQLQALLTLIRDEKTGRYVMHGVSARF